MSNTSHHSVGSDGSDEPGRGESNRRGLKGFQPSAEGTCEGLNPTMSPPPANGRGATVARSQPSLEGGLNGPPTLPRRPTRAIDDFPTVVSPLTNFWRELFSSYGAAPIK